MRMIGLLGGMSFESTAVYYRRINEGVRKRLGRLHSARLLLNSLDFQQIVEVQQADRWEAAGRILAEAARDLEVAGAECILICSNTMHRVIAPVQEAVDLPILNLVEETARSLCLAGHRRPLLLATRYTMEHGFYADQMRAFGVDVLTPDEDDRAELHRVIFDELCAGQVRSSSRDKLLRTVEAAARQGADSVILGCTELGLILEPDAMPLPAYDTTVIHCDAAIRFALRR